MVVILLSAVLSSSMKRRLALLRLSESEREAERE